MTKRIKSSDDCALKALRPETGEEPEEMMVDIPDFTPEQWAWLKAQTLELEKAYAPTRSLITGL